MTPYYSEAGITIYHGSAVDVLPTLPKAHLLLTDPPYQQSKSGGGMIEKRATYHAIRGLSDFDPSWLCGQVENVTLEPHGYIFCSKDILPQYCGFMRSRGWGWDVLTYAKRNPLPAKNNKYLSDSEFVVFFRAPGKCYFNNELPYEHYFKVKHVNCAASEWGHPTEKDVAIIGSMIQVSSKVDDLIIDPYMGSGTTLRAAKDLCRRAVGIEIEERYCEMAALRLSQGALFANAG